MHPKNVATPFPPLNNSHIGNICPTTENSVIDLYKSLES